MIFSARCNIYIHLALMLRCQCPSVCLTEVHWRIIAKLNLGFKFRSHFTAHCGRRAARLAAVLLAVLLAGGSSRAMLASARSLVEFCEQTN